MTWTLTDRRDFQRALRHIAVPCTREHVRQLRFLTAHLSYKPGQVLFYAGHEPSGFYVVTSGKVSLYKEGDAGRRTLAAQVAAPVLLGARNLLKRHPYAFTAEAAENSSTCFVAVSRVKETSAAGPPLRRWIRNALSHRPAASASETAASR